MLRIPKSKGASNELTQQQTFLCRNMKKNIQSNLNSSNTYGSFTIANSNLFLNPYEILPLAPKSKYLRKFSYFIMKLYVVCTH